LAYPDFAKEHILDIDSSGRNVGAVLSQVRDGREVVIAYQSMALSVTKKNYCTTKMKLMVVIEAAKHFRLYLYERMLCLWTNHACLIWLCKRA